jgi:hypothetical protein
MNLIRLIIIGMLTVFALNLTAKFLWAHDMSWLQCTSPLWLPPLVLAGWAVVSFMMAFVVWLWIQSGKWARK